MKFNLVEMFWVGEKLRVTHTEDVEEREDVETRPNGMGFYYYPATKDQKEAEKELGTCLLEQFKSRRAELDKGIKDLEGLLNG